MSNEPEAKEIKVYFPNQERGTLSIGYTMVVIADHYATVTLTGDRAHDEDTMQALAHWQTVDGASWAYAAPMGDPLTDDEGGE